MQEIFTIRTAPSNKQIILSTDQLKRYFQTETQPVYLVSICQNKLHTIYLQETAAHQPTLRYYPELDKWYMEVTAPFDVQSIMKFTEADKLTATVATYSIKKQDFEKLHWPYFTAT